LTTFRDIAPRLLPDLWSGFALLSRLPVPDHHGTGADSAWAWPLVGAALGSIAALVAGVALWLGFTPGVVAALVLTLGAI
jgi:adenosylcobinamide-GDP ribazoletransferase